MDAMKKNKLTTGPYKGTTDTYPKDMMIRNYIFDVWRRVAKRFGYEEYDTPLIESAQLYKAKSGEEISNQLYNFTDKGGREIALRPEMTPSLARMIAAKKKELTFPLRWFNIGKFYRYEKPQRGRRREFFQLNIDLLGMSTIDAELEIIQYVMDVMKEFDAPKDTFELRINNRYLLDYLFTDILKLSDELIPQLARAIDNFSKMKAEDFKEYLTDIGLDNKQLEEVLDFLSWDLSKLELLKGKCSGADQLLELFDKAKGLDITNIAFNPSIMRGLDYYTGTVIEMFDIGGSKNPRAMFGGGRYDDLLTIFGEEKIPAFGLGWGDIIMTDYLSTYNLLPNTKSNTDVYVTLMDKSLLIKTTQLTQELRKNGINTLMCLEPTKLNKQLKEANRKGIRWVIFLGEDEIKQNKVQLKDMDSGDSSVITISQSIQKIKEI